MIHPFPAGFRTQAIDTGCATIHTRICGTGAPVVMLQGFTDTGDMWGKQRQ